MTHSRLAALVLLATLLVAACRDGSNSEPAATATAEPSRTATAAATGTPEASATATNSPSGVAPTAGCEPERAHAVGSSRETIVSGGAEREYILHVPASYTGSDALPLVLNLHGYGSNAQQQASYSGLPAKGDSAGFVVVTPQGTGQPAFWNILGAASPDDAGFMRDLIDRAEAGLCIDAARVYSAGMSNGAAMTLRLACNLSDRIAAAASVTGTTFPANCPSTRAVPVIAFHGTADPVVPYEGGRVGAGLGERFGLSVAPIEDSVMRWAEHDGCAGAPVRDQVTEHVSLLRYDGCVADVRLYTVDGGGHTWPGAIDVSRLGATTHEISATDLIWDFFAAHAMP